MEKNNLSLGAEDFAGNTNLEKSISNIEDLGSDYLEKAKGLPIGTINQHNEIKTAEGWKWITKEMKSKLDGKKGGTETTPDSINKELEEKKGSSSKNTKNIDHDKIYQEWKKMTEGPEGENDNEYIKEELGKKYYGSYSKENSDKIGESILIGDENYQKKKKKTEGTKSKLDSHFGVPIIDYVEGKGFIKKQIGLINEGVRTGADGEKYTVIKTADPFGGSKDKARERKAEVYSYLATKLAGENNILSSTLTEDKQGRWVSEFKVSEKDLK